MSQTTLTPAQIQKYVSNFQQKSQTISSTGGKLIRCYNKTYDYFHGNRGWSTPTRFKLRQVRSGLTGANVCEIVHVSGYELSAALQATILKEMQV